MISLFIARNFFALGSTLSDLYMNTPDTLIQNHMVSLLLSFTFNLLIHCNLREFHENDILLDHGFIFFNLLCQSLSLRWYFGPFTCKVIADMLGLEFAILSGCVSVEKANNYCSA